jgi:hypothetical protein
MNPHVRSLSAALALVIVAAAYFVFQARTERPGPPRPAPALSAARPTALPPAPPTAHDILDQRVTLDLRGDQVVRLKALDRQWTHEISGLTAMIQEAEREFSVFVSGAQGTRGASLPEIEQRSATFSQLSAELRERRQHHSDAALRVLAEWQRQRLALSRAPATERTSDGTGTN